mgnify:CR=1 FL=1
MDLPQGQPEDVIPFVLTVIVSVLVVLLVSGSINAVNMAEQCSPASLATVQAQVNSIVAREGTAYRVDTAGGGWVIPQDARLTRVQLRGLLNSTIAPCASYLGPVEGRDWQALADRVAAEIGRRE